MDEELNAETGANNPAPTPEKPAPAPAPSPAPPPAGKPIVLTEAEYRALFGERERRLELEREKQAQVEAAEGDKLRALAEKGQFQEALKQHQDKSKKEIDRIVAERDGIQQRYLARERSLAVNDATAGVAFLTEFAAKQARQILEARFETLVDPQSGDVQVVDRITRRPAGDVAREWLASVEAAHFLAPKGKGGSPERPGNPQADAPAEPEPQNLTFEQQVMVNWQKDQAAKAANGWELPIQTQSRIRASQQAR